jgi:hypothetical protein
VGDSSAASVRQAIANAGLNISQSDINTYAGSAARAAQTGYTSGTAWNSSVSGR